MSNIVVDSSPLKPGPAGLVLIGHSNAGKSPLGAAIEQAWSTPPSRWLHFDFGHHLRRIWRREEDAGLSIAEVSYLDSVMHGRLFDDDHFSIPRTILAKFLQVNEFRDTTDHLILNGLPRHTGQAAGIASMGIGVKTVVYLSCTTEVAFERKRAAEAGNGFEDRIQRNDNSFEIFCRKAASFEAETLPLLEYYANSGVLIIEIPVMARTGPADMLQLLAQKVVP